MRWTIRRKLTAWYAGMLLVVLVILSVILYMVLHQSLMAQAERFLAERAQQIITVIAAAKEDADSETDGEGSHLEASDPDLIRDYGAPGVLIEISDANGAVLNRSPELEAGSLGEGELESVLRDSPERRIEIRDLPRIGSTLIDVRSLSVAGARSIIVRVGRSIEPIAETLELLQRILTTLVVAAIIVAAAVGAFLARRALAPIDRITRTAQEIGAGDLHQRLQLRGPNDEVTRLADAFDAMLDRVEAGYTRERRFSADVAHELRTPLTILKGTAEVALRSNEGQRSAHRNALVSIEEETDRMIRLVQSLLLLSRSEPGELPLSFSEVSVPELIHATVASLSSAASAKGVELTTQLPMEMRIDADVDWIRQMVTNLLTNAISYTPQGGSVRVSLRVDEAYAVIAVTDTGIGIPEKDLPHIFERFYRPDAARSRRSGGLGLGLAIVRSIVEAHNGRIDVTSRQSEGTTFHVWLPLHQQRVEPQEEST